MALTNEPPSAYMNPWLLVEAYDDVCLFGFAIFHPNTGGLSWVLSTPATELDEVCGRARMVSGRIYRLGTRIELEDLSEEGSLARRLLVNDMDKLDPDIVHDREWLVSQKVARYLGLEPPARRNSDQVAQFMAAHIDAYRRKRGPFRFT
jgi:hypothetical protein